MSGGLRVGLVGAGRIGAFHARTLRDHTGIDELLVNDADHERAETLAGSVGATAVAAVPALLEQVDALVVAAATPAHAELITAAAAASLPVFCEKPIALDVATTRAAIAQVNAAGIELQMGFQRRFDAGYQAARARIEAGELGTLFTVRMAASDAAPPPEAYIPTSGGIFRDMLIHDFDALRWLTGQEVTSVHALGAVRGEVPFDRYDDVDTAAVLLELADGTPATLTGTRANARGYDVRVELAGSGDSIAIGLDDRTPLVPVGDGVAWPSGSPYGGFLDRFADAYRAELDEFVNVARGEVASPCSGEDALEALLIAEAAERSRRERRPVACAEVR